MELYKSIVPRTSYHQLHASPLASASNISRSNRARSASRSRRSVSDSKSNVLVGLAGSGGGEAGNVLGCSNGHRKHVTNAVEQLGKAYECRKLGCVG